MDQPDNRNDKELSDTGLGISSVPGSPSGQTAQDMTPAEPGSTVPSQTGPGAKNSKAGKEVFEWVKALAIAGVLVILIRWLLFNPFIVDGESMQPNFWNGERIIVNKAVYDIRKPKAGEVIVFHVPDEHRDYIKRVIAVGGDTVKVQGDDVYVNGTKIEEPYLKDTYEEMHGVGQLYNEQKWSSDFPNETYPDGKVPSGMLYVMGDNRPNSKDSRMIGYVPIDRVVGRAELVFWPLDKIKYIGRGY
ncbi:signal peptidase I [Cohnella sp. 56]|uniref:signal peptidase I n=2 Tax=Cohnella sp. 56 TaxID=3113722 RepID=UPI0030EA06EE